MPGVRLCRESFRFCRCIALPSAFPKSPVHLFGGLQKLYGSRLESLPTGGSAIPRLTSGATPTTGDPETGATIDPSGQGWLRLATATNNQANGAYFDTPIPSAGNKVTITFDATCGAARRTEADGPATV